MADGSAPRREGGDAALDTLFLPFTSGALNWPETGRALFMRARAGGLPDGVAPASLICQQSFKPYADALVRNGFALAESASEHYPLVLLLPPRQREEARASLARALQQLMPGGVVVVCALNNEGARSLETDLARLVGSVHSLSKHKCRVCWAEIRPESLNLALIDEWLALDAPRPIAEGRFLSRPGLFAWSRLDVGSALLVRCLPDDLAGQGADLGAGFGYLAAEVLARCPAVTSLDLYEAEARALELARLNLQRELDAGRARLDFHWHDVTQGLGGAPRYDFIVSNPPFHEGRADQPEIGCAFIVAAANALRPGGRLWLVANRHLPYEQVLKAQFRSVRLVAEEQGFKVIEAVKAHGGKGALR